MKRFVVNALVGVVLVCIAGAVLLPLLLGFEDGARRGVPLILLAFALIWIVNKIESGAR